MYSWDWKFWRRWVDLYRSECGGWYLKFGRRGYHIIRDH